MKLNAGQVLAIVIVTLGVLVTSTAQLTDLFGAVATKYIVSASSLLTSILGGVVGILFGQGNQIAAVQAMPGVEKITVNSQANAVLATLAVDPSQNKIEPTPEARQAVQATASAAT